MQEPSTEWKEIVAADEHVRFEKHARLLTAIQKRKSEHFGNGRALHRKQLLALDAKLAVASGLPAAARQGIFAEPKSYDCLIRLSNGSLDVKADRAPDIRGFALKVLGLDGGPSALGNGTVTSQDFLLINHEAFSSPGVEPFMAVVKAAARGNMALVGHMFATHGFFGGLGQLKKAAAMFAKPFTGFATENFSTVVPLCCGPYAVRVRLGAASSEVNKSAREDWASDMRARLAKGPLEYPLQLQFFVSESTTPIENASVVWPEDVSPFVTVAMLTIPPQSFEGEAKRMREERAETTFFDPWNALLAHRPLGEIMRARRVAYYASQEARGAQPPA